jgi:hypothetical protein
MVRKTMHVGTKIKALYSKLFNWINGEVDNVIRNEMGHHQT